MPPHFGEQLKSAHLRQNQVENYEVGQGSRHLGTGLSTIGSRAHDIPMLGQHFSDKLARRRIILDYKDWSVSANLSAKIQAAFHGGQQGRLLDGLDNVFIRAKQR